MAQLDPSELILQQVTVIEGLMARGLYPLALAKLFRLQRNHNFDNSQRKQVTRLLCEGLLSMGNYRTFLKYVRYIDFQNSTFLKEGIIRSLVHLGQYKNALRFLISYGGTITWSESMLKIIYPELEMFYRAKIEFYRESLPDPKTCAICNRPMIFLAQNKTHICACRTKEKNKVGSL